ASESVDDRPRHALGALHRLFDRRGQRAGRLQRGDRQAELRGCAETDPGRFAPQLEKRGGSGRGSADRCGEPQRRGRWPGAGAGAFHRGLGKYTGSARRSAEAHPGGLVLAADADRFGGGSRSSLANRGWARSWSGTMKWWKSAIAAALFLAVAAI